MSKELESLKRIRREAGTPYFSTLYDIDMWREDFATVETALKEKEKQDEILRIIKKTFSLRDALLQLCEKEHKIFPDRFNKIKEWLK